MRCLAVALSLSLIVPLSTAWGQQPLPVEPGARMRVTHSCTATGLGHTTSSTRLDTLTTCQTNEGKLATMAGDSIVLMIGNRPDALAIPRSSIHALQMRTTRRASPARLILVPVGMTAAGLLSGALVGCAVDPNRNDSEMGCFGGFVIGGSVGAGLGLLTGVTMSVLADRDRWEKLPLDRIQAGVAPQHDERFAEVESGRRVRVRYGCTDGQCRNQIGSLVALTPDSIVLVDDRGTRLATPLNSLMRVETTGGGERSHLLLGTGVGALAGVGTIWVAWPYTRYTEKVVAGGLIGAAFGALVGWAIKTDRWEDIPLDQLQVRFAPLQDGGFALGLKFTF